MLIKCPNCGQSCELDEEPVIGPRMICPFCKEKFSYFGGEASEGIKSGRTTYHDSQGRLQGASLTDSAGKTTYRDAQGRMKGSGNKW